MFVCRAGKTLLSSCIGRYSRVYGITVKVGSHLPGHTLRHKEEKKIGGGGGGLERKDGGKVSSDHLGK